MRPALALFILTACGASSAPVKTAATEDPLSPSPLTPLANELVAIADAIEKKAPPPSSAQFALPTGRASLGHYQGYRPRAPVSWHTIHATIDVYQKGIEEKHPLRTRFSVFVGARGLRVALANPMAHIRPLPKLQSLPADVRRAMDKLVTANQDGTIKDMLLTVDDFVDNHTLANHLTEDIIDSSWIAEEPPIQRQTIGYHLLTLAVIGDDADGSHYVLGAELTADSTGRPALKRSLRGDVVTIALMPIQSESVWRAELAKVCKLAGAVNRHEELSALRRLRHFASQLRDDPFRVETRFAFHGLGGHVSMNYKNLGDFVREQGAPIDWACPALKTLLGN